MDNTRIHKLNRESDLYFNGGEYTNERVIFIPKNWCDEFIDHEYDDIYGWIGGPHVLDFQTRQSKEYLTSDAQGWIPVVALISMKQLTEAEARELDPDLFTLLDAVRDGVAV